MTDTPLAEDFEIISGTVDTARLAIDKGHFVDLIGLDRAIADLCAAASALPQPHQARAALKLSRLAHDLSALAEALTQQRDAMAHATEAETRKRAGDAYSGSAVPGESSRS